MCANFVWCIEFNVPGTDAYPLPVQEVSCVGAFKTLIETKPDIHFYFMYNKTLCTLQYEIHIVMCINNIYYEKENQRSILVITFKNLSKNLLKLLFFLN